MSWLLIALGAACLAVALKAAHDTRAYTRQLRAERERFEEWVDRAAEPQAKVLPLRARTGGRSSDHREAS